MRQSARKREPDGDSKSNSACERRAECLPLIEYLPYAMPNPGPTLVRVRRALAEFREHAARAFWVEERDRVAMRAFAGGPVDQAHAVCA